MSPDSPKHGQDTERVEHWIDKVQNNVMIHVSSAETTTNRHFIFRTIFSILKNIQHGIEKPGHILTVMTLDDLHAMHGARLRLLIVLERMQQESPEIDYATRVSPEKRADQKKVTAEMMQRIITLLERLNDLVNEEIEAYPKRAASTETDQNEQSHAEKQAALQAETLSRLQRIISKGKEAES